MCNFLSLKNKLLRKRNKYCLFTTYYEPISSERKYEYQYCINKNKNSLFNEIYLFVEEREVKAALNFGVKIVVTKARPTFKDYFDFILKNNFTDTINIIANTDIFFFNSREIEKNLGRLIKGESCFALSRYDYFHTKPARLYDRSDSQDSWIFNGSNGLEKVKCVDFCMGIPGCDNRLAYELNIAGFKVYNPSKSIRSYHLHNVSERTYLLNLDVKIDPPYLLLPPTI